MKNLLTLLAECECWLGVEPTDEAQVAEVTELRERVRQGLGMSTGKVGCRECRGVGSVLHETGDGMASFRACSSCAPQPASEKEPLATSAASFLSSVAAKRGLDGLE